MKLTPKHWSWNGTRPDTTWLDDCADAPLVWLARSDALTPALVPASQLISLLSAEERVRLERFRVPADQQRFLVGRALLRILLSLRMNVPPERVELAYGPFGKPFVPAHAGKKAPHFNVSHSGNLVLLAFHPMHEVGVDVEHIRPMHDWEAVARRVFSDAEFHKLAALNPAERPTAFFRAWARHEAALKTLGLGFFDEKSATPHPRLTSFDLILPESYQGAVACLDKI